MNCSVHTTQPKPSNGATNHSRPRRGAGAESRSSTATGTFNDEDLWDPEFVFGFVFLFGLVFLQSKPSADNDKHEGEIKKQHTHTNKEIGICRTENKNTEARQDNTKQKAKAKHRLALNLSNGITSSKL